MLDSIQLQGISHFLWDTHSAKAIFTIEASQLVYMQFLVTLFWEVFIVTGKFRYVIFGLLVFWGDLVGRAAEDFLGGETVDEFVVHDEGGQAHAHVLVQDY